MTDTQPATELVEAETVEETLRRLAAEGAIVILHPAQAAQLAELATFARFAAEQLAPLVEQLAPVASQLANGGPGALLGAPMRRG